MKYFPKHSKTVRKIKLAFGKNLFVLNNNISIRWNSSHI